MKAISLWQPWATFVSVGWKTIETRTHQRFKSLAGQRIAIHAASKVDRAMPYLAYLPKMTALQNDNLWRFTGMCRGKIVCTATVTAARWALNVDFKERGRWNRQAMCEVGGKFCLFLEDIKPLATRIPFRGRQGIFNVPDELMKDCLSQSTQRTQRV